MTPGSTLILAERNDYAGDYVCRVRRDANGRETLTVVCETSSARDDAGILTAYRELLKRKLGIETLVELAAPGELKSLTGIDSRQKPVRLIDESKK